MQASTSNKSTSRTQAHQAYSPATPSHPPTTRQATPTHTHPRTQTRPPARPPTHPPTHPHPQTPPARPPTPTQTPTPTHPPTHPPTQSHTQSTSPECTKLSRVLPGASTPPAPVNATPTRRRHGPYGQYAASTRLRVPSRCSSLPPQAGAAGGRKRQRHTSWPAEAPA